MIRNNPVSLTKYYRQIRKSLDFARIKDISLRVNRLECAGCYQGFTESARLCFEELRRSGASRTRLIGLPADGRTAFFDFIMPEAWDVQEASLEIVEPAGVPRARIADLGESRFCVANRCAATPAQGITAELISWPEAGKMTDLTGRMVFVSDVSPGAIRDTVAARNALGIVSSFTNELKGPPDSNYWINGWKGGPGWYHTAEDKKLICFSLSPRRGKRLARLLAGHRPVKVLAKVRSRTYSGRVGTVTGTIPGAGRREILLMAHLYEPFMDDNAIGAAALIEICRAITSAVASGALPPLKRTLRFLMSQERYGFAQFFSDPRRAGKIAAAVSVDTLATNPAVTGEPIRLRQSPASRPFFGDFLLEELVADHLPGRYPWRLEPGNFSDDTWIADRTIGIPTSWLWTPQGGYHHNVLNAGAVDWDLAHETIAVLAAYVYLLATDDRGISRRIQEVVRKRTRTGVLNFYREERAELHKNSKPDTQQIEEKRRFFNHCLVQSLDTMKNFDFSATQVKKIKTESLKVNRQEIRRSVLLPEKTGGIEFVSAPDRRAANLIFRRAVPGIPFSLARIPVGERRPIPHDILEPAVNWLDGRRDLAEVFRLFGYQRGVAVRDEEKEKLLTALLYLEKYGYVTVRHKTVLTKNQVKKKLKALGIGAGDSVVLHSSLAGMGYVKGGPGAVCSALTELITGQGTVLMPGFNHGASFRDGAPGYFSPGETPTIDGAIPEYFRRRKDVFRSLNPTHSFSAWGKDAREYVRDHHKLDTMGEGSPLDRLEKAGGKVILIDAPTANTFHHVVETTNNTPCLGKRTEEYPVRLPDGKMVVCRTWGWRNGACPINDSAQYLAVMKKRGLLRIGRIGNAQILVFRMSDCRKVIEELLAGKTKGFGGCRTCPIRPRSNKWTVAGDWDEKTKKVRPDTTAFIGDYPG